MLYTLDGRDPVHCEDTLTWALWFEASWPARRVAFDKVGALDVSTVFLGVDHNFRSNGDPILFETMVFGPVDSRFEVDEVETRRYSTWDQAEVGHKLTVARLALQRA